MGSVEVASTQVAWSDAVMVAAGRPEVVDVHQPAPAAPPVAALRQVKRRAMGHLDNGLACMRVAP
jgi:hypothetical protein